MKLLFVIDSLGFGGAERQLAELIKGLDYSRFEIHVACLNYTADGYTADIQGLPVRIQYFVRTYKYDLRPLFAISRYILTYQIDLVHAFMNLGGLVGLAAAKFTCRPVVCSTIRDAKDKNLRVKLSKKILAKLSDILVSNSWAGLNNRFSTLQPHYRVVYNGVDFSRFDKTTLDPSMLKKDLEVSEFKHIVAMVASLSERKDHGTLLDAVPLVLEALPGTCFLLIGDGPRRREITDKIKLRSLENNVRLLGNRNDVDRIYHIMDLAVLLTNTIVHLEGLSNSLIEAMAAGLPVIATAGGGTDEVIKTNINGILVKPKSPQDTAEAIVDVLNDNFKSKAMADEAKRSVHKMFALHRYVKDYENIYRELS